MNGTQTTQSETPSGPIIELPVTPTGPVMVRSSIHRLTVFILMTGLAVFAAVLGFFPAKTSELLLSLSYGRGLFDGSILLGSEPFSHMLAGSWANPHWLFDVLAYLAFRIDHGQGFVLIAFKSLIISFCATCLTLVLSRGASCSLPVSTLVVSLGLLAASPYFDVNSGVVAFPFILLLVALLQARLVATSKAPLNICLILLMALWANLDSTFVIGLALWILSLILPEGLKSKRNDFLVCLTALVSCLVHPFSGHGFIAIPEILAPVGEVAVRMDPQIVERLFESGFSVQRFTNNQLALNPAGLAFPALIVLGSLSFFLNPNACKTWRLPAFLITLGLAAYRHKAIPMFGGIATSVTCLNLIEVLAVRQKWAEFSSKGGVFAFLILVIASLLALPGFLHGTGSNSRLPGWGLVLRDSHKALAEHLLRDHVQNPGKSLIASLGYPDHAAYVAWFAPGVRTFVDPRLHLFAARYGEFADIVEALGRPDSSSTEHGNDWRELLNKAGVAKVAASLRSMEASRRVVPRFLRESDWDSPTITGGWLVGSLRAKALHADQRLTAGKRLVTSLVDVTQGKDRPQVAPPRVNTYSTWEFWQPRNDPSGHTDSADLCLALNELLNPLPRLGGSARALAEARWGLHQVPDSIRANETVFRSLLVYGEMAGISTRPTLLTDLQEIEIVSACRRIISLRPDGNEALQAHGILADISNKRRFLDMEVAHRKEIVRIGRHFVSRIADQAANPDNPAGESNREIATKDLDKVAKQLDGLQGLLAKRLELYTNELTRIQKTSGREPRGFEKALLALQLGLVLEATKELEAPTTLDQVQQNERERSSYVLLNLQLSIQMGKLDDATDALAGDGVRTALGGMQKSMPHPGLLLPELLDARNIHPEKRLPAMTWLEIQLAAGLGDYQKAAKLLGTVVSEQSDFFNPRLNRRIADQFRSEGWLPFLARDQRTMEAVANASSLSLKADSSNSMPWLLTLTDTLAMISQEDSERIRVPAALIAELRVAEGNYLYLSGRSSEAGKCFREALSLSTHARQIAVQASRLAAPNFWPDNILHSALAEHAQRICSPITPALETARRMILLLELTMDQ